MKYFAVTFFMFLGILMPRPSLRVEQVILSGEFPRTVISSSILDHMSVCNTNSLRAGLSNQFSTLGKAGLNPEEVAFLIEKYELAEPIVIAGLYFLFAEQNYSYAKHLWYRSRIDGRLFERRPWTKTISDISLNVRDGVEAELEMIRDQTSRMADRCDPMTYEQSTSDQRHFEYNYYQLYNDWRSLVLSNLALIDTANQNIFIIFPSNDFIPVAHKDILDEVEQMLRSIKVNVVRLETTDLDEPWCLCGHLSDQGQAKILDLIKITR